MTRTVRTTMRPWLDVEVTDAEYTDLARQGVLLPEGEHTRTGGDTSRGAGRNDQ